VGWAFGSWRWKRWLNEDAVELPLLESDGQDMQVTGAREAEKLLGMLYRHSSARCRWRGIRGKSSSGSRTRSGASET
jgi:hypothetical protein